MRPMGPEIAAVLHEVAPVCTCTAEQPNCVRCLMLWMMAAAVTEEAVALGGDLLDRGHVEAATYLLEVAKERADETASMTIRAKAARATR